MLASCVPFLTVFGFFRSDVHLSIFVFLFCVLTRNVSSFVSPFFAAAACPPDNRISLFPSLLSRIESAGWRLESQSFHGIGNSLSMVRPPTHFFFSSAKSPLGFSPSDRQTPSFSHAQCLPNSTPLFAKNRLPESLWRTGGIIPFRCPPFFHFQSAAFSLPPILVSGPFRFFLSSSFRS